MSTRQQAAAHTGFERFFPYLLFAGALLVRFIYHMQVSGTPVDLPVNDAEYYHRWAVRLAGGEWLGDRIFFMSPLYPYIMGILYSVAGIHPGVVFAVQSVVGAAGAVLVYDLCRRFFNRQTGMIAGLVCAGYNIFIFYDGQLLKAALLNFFNIASVWLLVAAGAELTALPLLTAGIFLGASIGMRPNVLLFVPCALYWIRLSAGSWINRRFVRPALIFSAGIFLATFPIALRNYIVGGEWVLTIASGGMNLYTGNNPESKGTYTGASFITSEEPEFENEDFRREAGRRLGREVTVSEASRYWFVHTVRWMAVQPKQYLHLLWRKFLAFWNRIELPSDLNFYVVQDQAWILKIPGFSFGVIAPFGILGMVICRKRWNELFLPYAFIGITFVTNMVFFVLSKYRLPMLAFLIMFAAFAVKWLSERINGQDWKKVIAGLSLLSAAAFFVNQGDPALEVLSSRRMGYLVVGSLLEKRGDRPGAEKMFRRSLTEDPGFGLAHFRLSGLYETMGRAGDAREHARLAVLYGAGDRRVQRAAGDIPELFEIPKLFNKGLYEKVIGLSRDLITKDPDNAYRYHNNIGLARYRQKKYREALIEYTAAVTMNPSYATAFYNRGLVHIGLGNIDAARADLKNCLELDPGYRKAVNKLNEIKE